MWTNHFPWYASSPLSKLFLNDVQRDRNPSVTSHSAGLGNRIRLRRQLHRQFYRLRNKIRKDHGPPSSPGQGGKLPINFMSVCPEEKTDLFYSLISVPETCSASMNPRACVVAMLGRVIRCWTLHTLIRWPATVAARREVIVVFLGPSLTSQSAWCWGTFKGPLSALFGFLFCFSGLVFLCRRCLLSKKYFRFFLFWLCVTLRLSKWTWGYLYFAFWE